MYDLQNTDALPLLVKNKPKEQQEAFVKAFNSALLKGLTNDEALLSGTSAMAILSKRNSSVNKSDYSQRKRPSHVPDIAVIKALREEQAQALIQEEIEKQRIESVSVPPYLGRSLPRNKDRNVIAANFDNQDRFVILFDTGEQLISKSMAIKEYVEQFVSVNMKGQEIVPGNYVTYTKPLSGFSVVIPQTEHGVAVVNPVTVRNSSGKEVTVSVSVDNTQTVTITSNISLDGHYAVIS